MFSGPLINTFLERPRRAEMLSWENPRRWQGLGLPAPLQTVPETLAPKEGCVGKQPEVPEQGNSFATSEDCMEGGESQLSDSSSSKIGGTVS